MRRSHATGATQPETSRKSDFYHGLLEKAHLDTHGVARELYDHLIDYGGHPNERSITSQVAPGDIPQLIYLMTGEHIQYKVCLKTTARVGVCALEIFRYSERDRFKKLNVEGEIDRLKRGL